MICDVFHDYAGRLSFAEAWIDRFLSIQNL